MFALSSPDNVACGSTNIILNTSTNVSMHIPLINPTPGNADEQVTCSINIPQENSISNHANSHTFFNEDDDDDQMTRSSGLIVEPLSEDEQFEEEQTAEEQILSTKNVITIFIEHPTCSTPLNINFDEISPDNVLKMNKVIRSYAFHNYGAAVKNELSPQQNIECLRRFEILIRKQISLEKLIYYNDYMLREPENFSFIISKYPDFNPEMTALIFDHQHIVSQAFYECSSVANNRKYNVDPSPSPVGLIKGLLGGGRKKTHKSKQKEPVKSQKDKPVSLSKRKSPLSDGDSDSDIEQLKTPQQKQKEIELDRLKNHNINPGSSSSSIPPSISLHVDNTLVIPSKTLSKAQKIQNVQRGTGIKSI